MSKTPILKPHWLDIISCCGAKTQLSIIYAIVKYQADGTIPDFKGIKLALFLALARDADILTDEQPEAPAKVPGQDETQAENDTNGNHGTAMSPQRRDDILKTLLTDFYTSGKAASLLGRYHNIHRNEYPFLLSHAIRENPPSDDCLTSNAAFLKYITNLTEKIDRNIREGGPGF